MSPYILPSLLAALLPAAPPGAPCDVHAFVIAVRYPSESRWYNPVLSQGIADAAADLKRFFEGQGGCVTEVDTTASGLRSFLRRDLYNATSPVVMLFVLGHGEAKDYSGSTYGRDLMIIPSDAPSPEDPNGVEASAVFLGQELLPALATLPKQTIGFVFVDTCNAGAAQGGLTELLASRLKEVGRLRLGVLGASVDGEKAYGMQFTKALARLWAAGGCPTLGEGPTSREQLVRELSDALAGQGPLRSNPVVVLPFPGEACFSSEYGLLAVFGKLLPKSVLRVDPVDRTPPSSRSFALNEDVEFVRLPRRSHTIRIDKPGGTGALPTRLLDPTTVDLKARWVSCIQVGASEPRTFEWEATALERCAGVAEQLGAPAAEVFDLQDRALVSYWRAGKPDAVGRLLAAMDRNPQAPSAWKDARALASKRDATLVYMTPAKDLDSVGGYLAKQGEFQLAGEAFKIKGLRERAPDGFQLSTFAYTAAGQEDLAANALAACRGSLSSDAAGEACAPAIVPTSKSGALTRLMERLLALLPGVSDPIGRKP